MKTPIDFTQLWDKVEGYAVHCSTKDEAEEFIGWSRALYPGMMEAWEPGEINYSKHESETIYTFDYKMGGEWRKHKLLFGSVNEAKKLGYKIIEFSDIYTPQELEESEMPIESLLGLN